MTHPTRKDQKFLAEFVKKGKMSPSEAKYLAALAYIEVPDEDRIQGEWKEFVLADRKKGLEEALYGKRYDVPTREEFPLHECVCYIEGNQWYFLLKITDGVFDITAWETQEKFGHPKVNFNGLKFKLTVSFTKDVGITILNKDGSDYDRLCKRMCKQYPGLQATYTDEAEQGLLQEALISIYYLRRWCEFNHRQDRYCMTVNEEDVNKRSLTLRRKDKPATRVAFGPRIVYLNRFPVSHGSAGVGSGREVEPHQRRGYSVTLRAERFKNHRDFGIEKGHYRKPGWVGDRTKIVNGQIYTVIDETKDNPDL